MKKNAFGSLLGWSVPTLILGSGISGLAAVKYVDLHPPGADYSEGSGVTASNQVGSVRFLSGALHAALWSGTSASFVDLNPPGAVDSVCTGAGGDQQVGYAVVRVEGQFWAHAALWTGTAESFQDLHPPWAQSRAAQSMAFSTTGSEQRGSVRFEPGIAHQAVWYGSAVNSVDLGVNQPALDLRPEGFSKAVIRVANEGLQAGYVVIGDDSLPPLPGEPAAYGFHAALWHGTPASFVDLHPAGMTGNSEIYAACGPYQVGLAQGHAALWSGTAESFVDLHTTLGTNYLSSVAVAVWTDGIATHIVGTAVPNEHRVNHAMLWTITDFEAHGLLGLVRLNAICMGDQLQLTWPSSASGFVLEQKSGVGTSKWESVPASPSLVNGRWTVGLPISSDSCCFRLRK